jgi:hypothetical protein
VIEEVLKRIEEMEQSLDDLVANFDRAEYTSFQRIAPDVWRNINGEWFVHDQADEPAFTRADFDRAHGFVVESIVRLQAWSQARGS